MTGDFEFLPEFAVKRLLLDWVGLIELALSMIFFVFTVFANGFVLRNASFFFAFLAGLCFSGLAPFAIADGRYLSLEPYNGFPNASYFYAENDLTGDT